MNIEEIKKIDWEKIVGRKADLQKALQFSCNGAGGFGMFLNIKDLSSQLYLSDGRTTSIYFSKKEYALFLKKVYKKLDDVEFVKKCESRIMEVCDDCIRRGTSLSKKVKQESTKEDLLTILKEFDDVWNTFYPIGWLFFFIAEIDSFFEKKLIKDGFDVVDAKKIVEICAQSGRLSPVIEGELETLRLAKAVKLQKKNTRKQSENLSRKYGWMSVYNTEDEERRGEYYLKEAKKIINSGIDIEDKIESMKEGAKENENNFRSCIKKIPNSTLKEQLKFFHVIGYLRDKREEIRDKLTILEKSLYSSISQKCGISIDEVVYLSNDEIGSLIIDSSLISEYKKLAQKRSHRYSFYVSRGKLEIVDDEKKTNEIQRLFEVKEEVNEMRGQIAYKQLEPARGKVRVVLNNNELKNFKKGEVLVTSMTKPNYLMAMKISSAIVTDEGGITCHAAIVARELKIPCIIGTKIATQVLHDGDLVEVDANVGIVKILKRLK